MSLPDLFFTSNLHIQIKNDHYCCCALPLRDQMMLLAVTVALLVLGVTGTTIEKSARSSIFDRTGNGRGFCEC